MKFVIGILAFTLLCVSCNNSKPKDVVSSSVNQDSIQVKQPELPPLESGEVEYKDDAFREIVEIEGHN